MKPKIHKPVCNFSEIRKFSLLSQLAGLGRFRSSRTADGLMAEDVDVDLDANVIGVKRKYNGDVVQDAVMVMDGGKITDVFDASTPYWMAEVGRFPDGSYSHSYDRDGRLTADGTRNVTSIDYHPFGNLPRRITMGNGDYTQSEYFPDGTLRRRTFSSRKVETVVSGSFSGYVGAMGVVTLSA